MVYHLKIPSFTICLQLKKNIPSLLLPIQKPLDHLKISPFTICLHSNIARNSSEAVLKSDCQNRLGGSNICFLLELFTFLWYNVSTSLVLNFFRSVLFEKHQPFGDCTVNERFANTLSAFLSCLSVNRYERIKK